MVSDYGTPSERVLCRARAALLVADRIGWPWRAACALGIMPTCLLDVGYRVVARLRYRVFGRYDSCPVPAPEHRDRFLDI